MDKPQHCEMGGGGKQVAEYVLHDAIYMKLKQTK